MDNKIIHGYVRALHTREVCPQTSGHKQSLTGARKKLPMWADHLSLQLLVVAIVRDRVLECVDCCPEPVQECLWRWEGALS